MKISRLRLAALCVLIAGVAGVAAEPTPAGKQVPDDLLKRLAAQYVPEDDKSPEISEHDKLRRYRNILREGAWAERQYAEAANLYRVRELMMAAARGLATLEGTPESRQALLEIAKRQNVEGTPPLTRVVADLLLTRVELAALEDEQEKQIAKTEEFVGRYAGTSAAAKALMAAVDLAKIIGTDGLRQGLLKRLETEYLDNPEAATFLEREGLFPFHGRLVKCRVKLLDGTELSLPRDMLGRETVLYFWSMSHSELYSGGKGYKTTIPEGYRQLYPHGVELIGINLDDNVKKVTEFIKQEKLDWPQACSGLGTKDPLFQRFAIPTVPAWWVLTPDGRLYVNNYRNGSFGKVAHWGHTYNTVEAYASELQGTIGRGAYYRSGEFLLDEPEAMPAPPPAAGDVPQATLDAIRKQAQRSPYLGLSATEKADSYREALRLGRAAEVAHPKAESLATVRRWMLVASRWLATQQRNTAAAREARQLAAKILAARPQGGAGLLADYVQLSEQLAADERNFLERITAFRRNYAQTRLKWAADMLGIVLVIECGHEPTRVAWLQELADAPGPMPPKVRGFLRDFCYVNVDARIAEESFRMRATPRYDPLRPFYEKWTAQTDRQPPHCIVRAELPRLDGGKLQLPDPQKRLVVLHFWSVAKPPALWPWQAQAAAFDDLKPTKDVLVVGVNLDESRAEVEKFLKDHPEYKDWVHVFRGKGWTDPLARELDILDLPRSVLLHRGGEIHLWAEPGQFGRAIADIISPRVPGQKK